ncbi:MAG: serine/threonine protein kinase [Proteobacteria bacterium]|nr:MAG: serine/threonine protein kinase [Pseudomonadota bacterium]
MNFGVLFLGAAIAADSWPEFRGPTGQGIVREGRLPTEWSPTKNVAWKVTIPGAGWSSPVIAAGRVYLTTAVAAEKNGADEQSLRALCLDSSTGHVLWDIEVFRQNGRQVPRIHPKNSHASPTALVHGGHLYVHFGHQGTACLDLAGKILWRNTSLYYQPVHGNGGSPIIVGDKLVFSCDGGDQAFIVALSCSTGEVLWKTERSVNAERRFSFSTPLLITVNGRPQIVSPGSNMVGAYDPDAGREIWRVEYDGYSVIPRPVYGHGLVFVCTGFNNPTLLAIRPDGEGDVTRSHVAWKTRRAAPLTPSALLVGDELYLVSDNGVASCLDAQSGRVHWQQRIEGNYSASPIYGDGKVYSQSEQGTAVVMKAAKRYQLLATNSLGERTLASFAAADGALFIRTEKHLYRIGSP